MSCCRVPVFSGSQRINIIKQGKIFIKVTENGQEGEEVVYDPNDGDLHLNLVSMDCVDIEGKDNDRKKTDNKRD